MEKNLSVNVLPSPTFRWLKMNSVNVKVPAKTKEANPMVTRPRSVAASAVSYSEISEIPGGMGYDMDTFIRDSGVDVLKLSSKEGEHVAMPVSIDYDFSEGANEISAVEIDAADDSELTVIMDFRTAKSAKGFAAVQTNVRLGKNAKVLLVQIQCVGDHFLFLNDIGSVTGDSARFEQIELMLSGEKAYQGSRTDLVGAKSSLKTDIGYLVKGAEHLDMNYIANHIGKKTECAIDVHGVLRDQAFKLFRGTIDLRRGAQGAVGNEMEDVLLMSDDTVNQTIPVILCDEEDVEGNHGATIGRIDESLLFYLESRGLTKDQVYEMMASARIDSVVNKIPDKSTRDKIFLHLKDHIDETYSAE